MNRLRYGAAVAVLGVLLGAVPADAAAGDLDSTFGGDGIAVTAEPPIVDDRLDVVVQDDGKVVVVGEAYGAYLVARFTTDGSLDPTFSEDGWLKVTFRNADYARATAVGLDSTGRLLVGGKTGRGIGVTRIWPGGRVDRTYGDQGRALVPSSAGSYLNDLVVDPSDRVVFGGWRFTGSFEPNGGEMVVGRLTPDGDLDPTFRGGGLVAIDPPRDSAIEAIGLLADGRIVGAGSHAPHAGGSRTGLVRLWPDGRRDRSFGDDGIVSLDLAPGDEAATGLAVQAGGRVTVTGWSGGGARILLARLGPAGRRDPMFGGGDGVVVTDLGRGTEQGVDVVAVGAGRVAVVADMRGGFDQRAVVLRYGIDGALDPTFGGDGWTPVNPTTDPDAAQAIALAPSGDLVIAIGVPGPVGDQVGVARLLTS